LFLRRVVHPASASSAITTPPAANDHFRALLDVMASAAFMNWAMIFFAS